MASLRDTLSNLVEQYKASDTPLANLMRGDTEGAKQSVANAFEGMTKDPYAGLNVLGATAYHGSPHAFEKFLLDKVGTGQGLQEFGHGTYFSESPSVASKYMGDPDKYITTVNNEVVDTPIVKSIIRMGGNAKSLVDSLTNKLNAQKEVLNKASKEELIPGLSDYDIAKLEHDSILKNLNEAQSYIGKNIEHKQSGNFYKVDIPDENIPKMLEWEKPIGEQNISFDNLLNQFKRNRLGRMAAYASQKDAPGSTIYHALQQELGSPQAASNALQKAGIPGIKYTDQTYGTMAKNPTNYVVFDPSEVKILERNNKLIDLLKQ